MSDGDTNDLARLRALLDAYGGVPARWPERDRGWAARLIAESSAAAALQREAAALDAMLADAALPPPSPELMAAVLSESAASRRPFLALLWPFGPIWRPAATLATACVLGIAVGLTTPPAEFMATGEVATDIEELALGPYASAEILP